MVGKTLTPLELQENIQARLRLGHRDHGFQREVKLESGRSQNRVKLSTDRSRVDLHPGKASEQYCGGPWKRRHPALPGFLWLEVEYPVAPGGPLRLQNRQRNVVDRAPGRGLPVEAAAVGVAVHDQICAVAIDDLGEA